MSTIEIFFDCRFPAQIGMRVRNHMDGLLSFEFHLGLRINGSWLFIDVRKQIMIYLI